MSRSDYSSAGSSSEYVSAARNERAGADSYARPIDSVGTGGALRDGARSDFGARNEPRLSDNMRVLDVQGRDKSPTVSRRQYSDPFGEEDADAASSKMRYMVNPLLAAETQAARDRDEPDYESEYSANKR